MSRGQSEADLIGQYLSAVIDLIKGSIKVRNLGAYYRALDQLKPIIAFLVRKDEKDAEDLRGFLKRIKAIDEAALKINGVDGPSTHFRRMSFKNQAAQDVFDDLIWVIQDKLVEAGYFIYKGKPGFYDPSLGRKSGGRRGR